MYLERGTLGTWRFWNVAVLERGSFGTWRVWNMARLEHSAFDSLDLPCKPCGNCMFRHSLLRMPMYNHGC